MKKFMIVLILLVIAGVFVFFRLSNSRKKDTASGEGSKSISVKIEEPTGTVTAGQQEKVMQLSSPVFKENQAIPADYTCDGKGINPPLHMEGVPLGTKALALVADDPDALSGVFTHWIVWNIDPSVSDIAENSTPPQSVQGENGAGKAGYVAPCPPSGEHHYRFKLYALDTKLDLGPQTNQKNLEDNMIGHILAKSEVVATYGRR